MDTENINASDAIRLLGEGKSVEETLRMAERIIPRHEPPPKYWVVIGTHIKSFTRQADAEADAIIAARNYPGQTIRVTKTIKAFRTKEPAVETLESE